MKPEIERALDVLEDVIYALERFEGTYDEGHVALALLREELERAARFQPLIEAVVGVPLDALRYLAEIKHGDEAGNRAAILKAALQCRVAEKRGEEKNAE